MGTTLAGDRAKEDRQEILQDNRREWWETPLRFNGYSIHAKREERQRSALDLGGIQSNNYRGGSEVIQKWRASDGDGTRV